MHDLQCNPCKWLVTLAGAMLLSAPLPAAGAAPACEAPAFRAFDFWLGEWTVTTPDGRAAGHNRIDREQAGCLLVEHWHGVDGSTGTSLNVYDPAHDQWRQLWVSPGTLIDIVGNLEEGSMVLEGTITYLSDARTRAFRGTWTRLPDGRVRQFFEEAGEDSDWQPWFDGIYTPVEP